MISTGKVRCAFAIAMLLVGGALAHAQSPSPVRLETTIPLPDVKGRIDHLAFDADSQRLFVAALGNNTVEVIDIKGGKVVRTINGLAAPQGVIYQPERKRLWIANAGDGSVRIFDALTFQPLRSIELGNDADNIRRDAATKRIFVGYGSGGIAIFDSEANKVGDIKVDAHPESFQLEKDGPRMFVNLPNSQKVAVIDRTKSAVVASWTTDDSHSNFPMALDEADGRLFVVCRKPAVLLVLDTRSGAIVAKLPIVGDSDDVFYDQKHKRIYASGGEGAIAVYQQQDADHYSKIAQLETVKGARTSLFVPQLNRLFLAVRQDGEN
ncbi:MAG TPA: YncE family protein, partial [Acidobacteriaceae bacterium]